MLIHSHSDQYKLRNWRFKAGNSFLVTLLWITNVVQNIGTNEEGSEADEKKLIIKTIHFYLTFLFHSYFMYFTSLIFQSNLLFRNEGGLLVAAVH